MKKDDNDDILENVHLDNDDVSDEQHELLLVGACSSGRFLTEHEFNDFQSC